MTIFFVACVSSQNLKVIKKNESLLKTRLPADTGIVQQALPPVSVTLEQQEKIWQEYCIGERKSTTIPLPNYIDP
jgi:hypothetical protein